ncbi:MAG TPA: type II toxin-antitoxin system VapC family toxin [Thermoanaerobaculia bacterium]|nr:type II toxin-antitoxin system VapC family toxin [Thermoanaerobaculia bacterium]
MILDSSTVAAIFLRQPGFERLIEALAEDRPAAIGAPSLVEAAFEIGLASGRDVHGLLGRFVQELGLDVVPFSEAHARAAVDAFVRYSDRRGAALGFGECLAYAVAHLARQPMLTADPRFAETDLELVITPGRAA